MSSKPITEERLDSPDDFRAQLKFKERENKILWACTNDFLTDEYPYFSEQLKFEISPIVANHMGSGTREFIAPDQKTFWRYAEWYKRKTALLQPATKEEVARVLKKKLGFDL